MVSVVIAIRGHREMTVGEGARSCFTCEGGTYPKNGRGYKWCDKCIDLRDDFVLAGWHKRREGGGKGC